jgi:Trk K+ transport system NAD-binding subunit
LIGDGRLTSTLSTAELEHALAVVAATGDDAVNVAVALTAKRLAPGIRTVVRVFDADFAHKLEAGGLVHGAISTSRVAAPTFAAAALFEDVVAAFADRSGLTTLRFRPAPSEWWGQSPRELGLEIPFVLSDEQLRAWRPDEPIPERAAVVSIERRPFVV